MSQRSEHEHTILQLGLCISLAQYAHFGQLDKSGHPYIKHPMRVMEAVTHPWEKMAAVLHDVLEDTWVTTETLESLKLPLQVCNAVVALTQWPHMTHALYMHHVKADSIAITVKIADLLDNLRPERMAAWRALDETAATRYHKLARKRLEDLCRYAGKDVPSGYD